MANVFVEFAGLIVGVLNSRKDALSMLMPDARSVGGPAHTAVMLVRDVIGLKGVPDFTVTRPTDNTTVSDEYAGWILRGDVEFSGTFKSFEKPDLAKTMDLKKVADASKLVAPNLRPLTATVIVKHGKLTPNGFAKHFDFFFKDGLNEKRVYGPGNEVELTDRLQWDLGDVPSPFQVSFKAVDGTHTVVTIPETVGQPILISNLAGGSGKAAPHFDAYYMFANGKRAPRIKRFSGVSGTALDPPENPDECRLAMFEE